MELNPFFRRSLSPSEYLELEKKLESINLDLESKPNEQSLIFEKATILLRLSRLPQVLIVAERLIGINPVIGHIVASLVYFEMDHVTDSIFHLNDAIELQPEEGTLYLIKAAVLDEYRDDFDQASILEVCEKAIMLLDKPDFLLAAYYYKIRTLEKLELFSPISDTVIAANQVIARLEDDDEGIISDFDFSEYFDSMHLNALCKLAERALEQEDEDGAIEYFVSANELGLSCIKNHPNCTDCYIDYAHLFVLLNEAEQAVSVLEEGIANNPDDHWLLAFKALAENAMGNHQAVIETVRKLSAINDLDDELVMLCKDLADSAGRKGEGLTIVRQHVEKRLVSSAYSPLLSLLPDLIDRCLELDSLECNVPYSAIEEMASAWGPYQAKAVPAEKIKEWLKQFDEVSEQIWMFNILRNLIFYSEADERAVLTDLHKQVENKIRAKLRRSNIAIENLVIASNIDASGGSESKCVRLYHQEVGISKSNCIQYSDIPSFIKRNGRIVAVVLVDDFIGTGNRACDNLDQLDRQSGPTLREAAITVFYLCIFANEEGADAVRGKLKDLFPDSFLIVKTTISETNRIFGEGSEAFLCEDDRVRAEEICRSYGARLWPEHPLGYGDYANTVVFSDNCPNNCLPILWSDINQNWTPLFPRR